jgi:7,8-dihydropterin-6-yl-methyl-4-(beta-D-ribofuranosyl)aminobenzene 5'-phosphate synthase
MAPKIKITCVVDNCVKFSSRLWGEHGLAILIQAGPNSILFDTGCSPDILEHNMRLLDEDMSRVKYIVLSHGHYDHCGGLEWAISKSRRPLIIADDSIFDKKLIRIDKEFKSAGIPTTVEKIGEKGDIKFIQDQAYSITQGIYVTGRIPRTIPFEVILAGKYFVEKKMMIEEDPFLDDHALVIDTDKGQIVILGCCHAGLINTLTYVSKTWQKPLLAIIGGMHLNNASGDRVNKTIAPLREKFKPSTIYPNHCTGLEAFFAIRNSLGASVKDFPAGSIVEF